MGAVDVIPFVPVAEFTIEAAVALLARGRAPPRRGGRDSHLSLRRVGDPPRAARAPRHSQGEFEGLRSKIGSDPNYVPDFGPNWIHPTAGCTAVGARFFLIAYNIQLDTADVDAAQAIAKAIRERDGGLPRVQAKGFEVEVAGRKLAQVSMNLLDYRKTSIARVFEEVERLAAARKLGIVDSELVGLVPARRSTTRPPRE